MIEARQVRYGVRSREILRGVDFRVEEGEFVGLIGPNGSDKSLIQLLHTFVETRKSLKIMLKGDRIRYG